MKIVCTKDDGSLKLHKFVGETSKTYKVEYIPDLSWENAGYGSIVKKKDVIYVGEFKNVIDILERWNALKNKKYKEENRLNKEFHANIEELEKELKSIEQ